MRRVRKRSVRFDAQALLLDSAQKALEHFGREHAQPFVELLQRSVPLPERRTMVANVLFRRDGRPICARAATGLLLTSALHGPEPCADQCGEHHEARRDEDHDDSQGRKLALLESVSEGVHGVNPTSVLDFVGI